MTLCDVWADQYRIHSSSQNTASIKEWCLNDFQLVIRKLRMRTDIGNVFNCGLTSCYESDIGLGLYTRLNCFLHGFARSASRLLH
jgi:hypothetical protein